MYNDLKIKILTEQKKNTTFSKLHTHLVDHSLSHMATPNPKENWKI